MSEIITIGALQQFVLPSVPPHTGDPQTTGPQWTTRTRALYTLPSNLVPVRRPLMQWYDQQMRPAQRAQGLAQMRMQGNAGRSAWSPARGTVSNAGGMAQSASINAAKVAAAMGMGDLIDDATGFLFPEVAVAVDETDNAVQSTESLLSTSPATDATAATATDDTGPGMKSGPDASGDQPGQTSKGNAAPTKSSSGEYLALGAVALVGVGVAVWLYKRSRRGRK